MPLKHEATKKREQTLLLSLLLSAWAPLATGIAVFMSTSATQIADFIRRSMELIVLLLSYLVFRYLTRKEVTAEVKERLERIVNLSVAVALASSGVVMLYLSLTRLQNYQPGGNVSVGLTIAILGFLVNFWFWRRYSVLGLEQEDAIMNAQRRLYLAKLFVDACVILALTSVAIMPTQHVTKYIDSFGSLAVAIYLLWTALRTSQEEQAKRNVKSSKDT